MQNVNCYHCGSNQNTFYASENGFALVKCIACGLLYVNPRPDDTEIEDSHKLGVHRGLTALTVTGRFSNEKVASYDKVLIDFFGNGSNLGAKSWLDIGCGHGEFLAALRNFSQGKMVLQGVEPNVAKQRSAQRHGLDVTYFDLNNHNKTYDFISLLNVFSHLPNPPNSFLSWKKLLNVSGELLLQTGDTAHFTNEEHYHPFYLPDHLSFASEHIVINILNRCGFGVIKIMKYPSYTLTVTTLVKELVKLFLPHHNSQIRCLIQRKRYAHTNMYILASLTDQHGV